MDDFDVQVSAAKAAGVTQVYGAAAVANEFLRRAREAHRSLGGTQLHELVYCAHGWHLALHGQPLLAGPVAACRGGVFIPELREAGCWGSDAVDGLLQQPGSPDAFPRLEPNTPAAATVEHVWRDYGPLSRYDLTRFILADGGPWDRVWNSDARHDCALIPNRLLREWFAQPATWRAAVELVSHSVDSLGARKLRPAAPLAAAEGPSFEDSGAIEADRNQMRRFWTPRHAHAHLY